MTLPAWSVKGIDPHVRELAKATAHARNMSLGQWLDSVILKEEGPAFERSAPALPPIAVAEAPKTSDPLAQAEKIFRQSPPLEAVSSRPPEVPVSMTRSQLEDKAAGSRLLQRASADRDLEAVLRHYESQLENLDILKRLHDQPASFDRAPTGLLTFVVITGFLLVAGWAAFLYISL